jgi:hypothetical protein
MQKCLTYARTVQARFFDEHFDSRIPWLGDLQEGSVAASWLEDREKLELDLLPDGRGLLKAAQATGSIDNVIGLLKGRSKKIATLEEIKKASAKGWSGGK